MAGLKKGALLDDDLKEERKDKLLQSDDIKDYLLDHDRPHKITFSITTSDLLKLKSYCIKNKVKQQDKAYIVFKDWIDKQDINL